MQSPKSNLALVVIDTKTWVYSRFVGNQFDKAVGGALLTESQVEHFRINPRDFLEFYCCVNG
jgi:hypothetical protein